MENEIVLAADLGGTNLRMAAIDRHGKILFRTKRATPRGENPEAIVEAIVESAAECRENCADCIIRGICVAVPGTVNVTDGKIETTPNLPALNDFPMVAALEEKLGIKAILENDANAAAFGENWLGAAKGFTDSICVTLGTGVGGGIITEGKILRGTGGTAGEVGHLCVEARGVSCRCGSCGCVEQYASATAIVRIAHELRAKFPDSILSQQKNLKAANIFEAGVEGDALALEVFEQMGFYLGVALVTLINVLNPEVIVISGGVSAGWELFTPPMRETIERRAYGGRAEKTKIVRGLLGDDAGILGAARLAFDALN